MTGGRARALTAARTTQTSERSPGTPPGADCAGGERHSWGLGPVGQGPRGIPVKPPVGELHWASCLRAKHLKTEEEWGEGWAPPPPPSAHGPGAWTPRGRGAGQAVGLVATRAPAAVLLPGSLLSPGRLPAGASPTRVSGGPSPGSEPFPGLGDYGCLVMTVPRQGAPSRGAARAPPAQTHPFPLSWVQRACPLTAVRVSTATK